MLKHIFSSSELADIQKNLFDIPKSQYTWDDLRDMNVIVFGAGLHGRCIVDILLHNGVRPHYIVDNCLSIQGTEYADIPVMSPAILSSHKDSCIVLTSAYAKEMAQSCYSAGVHNCILGAELPKHEFLAPPIGWRYEDMDAYAEIERLVPILDEESRSVLKGVLRFQLTLDAAELRAIYSPNMYFTEVLKAQIDYSTFFDIGAYTGDTLADYNKFSPCADKDFTYCAFEPDPRSFTTLKNATSTSNGTVLCFPYALGMSDSSFRLHIASDAIGTQVLSHEDNQESCITVKSVDTFVREQNIIPTVLKADVEGFESNVLAGAAHTLRTYRPAVIFSVYHLLHDIVSLPLYIHDLNLGYKVHLRHHTESYGDTIVYAIQK